MFRDHLWVPSPRVTCPRFLTLEENGPIGCAETYVRNYHYSLRNILIESSSLLLRGGTLTSHMVKSPFVIITFIILVIAISSIKVLKRTNILGEFRSLLKVVEFMLVDTSWSGTCPRSRTKCGHHDRQLTHFEISLRHPL
jgi:hypothetical protein